MVDISSQNNKINITVSSSGNTANTNVTPDYAQYYSEKSKEWAISDKLIDNKDYSSKYYANESKKQADISTAKATEVIESGNTAVSNIESARDNAITNVNTAGATQVALATEQATIATNKASEVVASGNEALANIDTAKNNAITSIANQETTSKTSLIDEGATQIGLIQNEGATQVANVQSTGFYMRDDKLYYVNSQGEETEFKSGGSGLEVCDIGMALYVDETKGLRRYLNGQIVDRNANTEAFFTRLQEITTLHPSLLCTEEEWQTAKTVSAFQQVGKFVFNYSGDEIVSVRIPAIVNIQGLFDLQNLGMTVGAGLPTHTHTRGTMNITGQVSGGQLMRTDVGASMTGAFYASAGYNSRCTGEKGQTYAINLDASRSWTGSTSAPNNSIYGNSSTVQQEAIQYPYFIQIATGSETENNIINEIELNNPYSLFDSKYSPHELNNLSWLKSEGQWNAKATYPTVYEGLLVEYNTKIEVGTTVTLPSGVSYTKRGLSVKYVTEEYTDYDFVLDESLRRQEKFRLPLLDGSEDLPSDEFQIVLTDTTTGLFTGIYQANKNGFVTITNNSGLPSVTIRNTVNQIASTGSGGDANAPYATIFLKRGETASYVKTAVTVSGATTTVYFSPAIGNGSLYFYVGETVQNANLIDAGRIGETMTTKSMVDGQWEYISQNVLTKGSFTGTDSTAFDLSSYLPNDGFKYEVMFTCWATSDTTSGSLVSLWLKSNLMIEPAIIARGKTRASSSISVGGTVTLSVGTDRIVWLHSTSSSNVTGIFLRILGYRRIGTNV